MTHDIKTALDALERIADSNADSLFAALETVARAVFREVPELEEIDAQQGVEFVTYAGERLDLATDCPETLEPLRKALDMWDSASPGTSPGLSMKRADAERAEPEPESFADFAKRTGIEIDARPIAARPDVAGSDWHKDSFHFLVTLTRFPAGTDPERAPDVIWTGFYSVGAAWPETWARNGCKLRKAIVTRPGGYPRTNDATARQAFSRLDKKSTGFGRGVSIHDSRLWETIRERFRAVAPLDVAVILESLQSDVSGADESFSDWADNLGMDSDSRKAESIWRACREIREQLERGLGRDLFREFSEIEP